jgi:hypothetical protein
MGSWYIAGIIFTCAGLYLAKSGIELATNSFPWSGIAVTGATGAGTAVLVTSGITIVGEVTGGTVGLGTTSVVEDAVVGVTGWFSQAVVNTRSITNATISTAGKFCFMVKTFLFGSYVREFNDC